ncbi:MAG: UvrD-helicase domain-containing protein [bacterium]
MSEITPNPAELASKEALDRVFSCIDKGKSFRLEAGAGAGKTYSLIKSLKYIIEKHGQSLLRRKQQVACITFTNVATNEINSRTDRHPVIYCSTIHAFCWSLIKDFQPFLRQQIPNLKNWPERLVDIGDVGNRSINYELGYPGIDDKHVSLHHNDVLALTIQLLNEIKFRDLVSDRYPYLFIDEYQDTDEKIAAALIKHFLDTEKGPLIGFFGDHWQKIYGDGCGLIDHPKLETIGKEANFRSAPVIVDCLNRMRPDLPQKVENPTAEGSVAVFHTNEWVGTRRTGQHWADDLPADSAHSHLEAAKELLTNEGWDFSAGTTKILMLTHNVLAAEQGYSSLAQVFSHKESFVKKEDDHIAFFIDILEPVCIAYSEKKYGEMFALLGSRTPRIGTHQDKVSWSKDMDDLAILRKSGNIGAVLDYLRRTKRPRLPEAVERKERELAEAQQIVKEATEETTSIDRLRKLRDISYQEVINLARFINDETPFSTKHGVKGAEFENVLVVCGRGWNIYNDNQFLEWAGTPVKIPVDKKESFERNRNLFYVACSRPKKRLAVLFTQKINTKAMDILVKWFGRESIRSLQISG